MFVYVHDILDLHEFQETMTEWKERMGQSNFVLMLFKKKSMLQVSDND